MRLHRPTTIKPSGGASDLEFYVEDNVIFQTMMFCRASERFFNSVIVSVVNEHMGPMLYIAVLLSRVVTSLGGVIVFVCVCVLSH